MNAQFLYLDESGDGGWTSEHGGSSNCKYFVYAGVILSAEKNYRAKEELNDLTNDYFDPAWVRPDEIHYADIVHGNGAFGRLSSDERDDMRDEIFDLILDLEPEVMATVVNKDGLKEEYGDRANPPKRLAFRATIDRFHKHLNEHEDVGVVTIDAAERSIDAELRDLIYDARSSGIKLPGMMSARDTDLPRIVDTVTMTPSEMSAGVQLADVVAYQILHQYRYSGESHGYEAIEDLFRSPENHPFTEPSVIPG